MGNYLSIIAKTLPQSTAVRTSASSRFVNYRIIGTQTHLQNVYRRLAQRFAENAQAVYTRCLDLWGKTIWVMRRVQR